MIHLLHVHLQTLRFLALDAKGGQGEYVRFRRSLRAFDSLCDTLFMRHVYFLHL